LVHTNNATARFHADKIQERLLDRLFTEAELVAICFNAIASVAKNSKEEMNTCTSLAKYCNTLSFLICQIFEENKIQIAQNQDMDLINRFATKSISNVHTMAKFKAFGVLLTNRLNQNLTHTDFQMVVDLCLMVYECFGCAIVIL
jgi:hypothetical protein